MSNIEKPTPRERKALERISRERHVPVIYGRIARCLVGKANFDEAKCAKMLGIPLRVVINALEDPRMQYIIQHRIAAITGDIDWCRNELAAFATVSYDQMISKQPDGSWKIDLDKARKTGALAYIRKLKINGEGPEQSIEIEPYDRQRAVETLARVQRILGDYDSTAQNITINFVPVTVTQDNTNATQSPTNLIDTTASPVNSTTADNPDSTPAQTTGTHPGDGN